MAIETGFRLWSSLNLRGYAGTGDNPSGWAASKVGIGHALSADRFPIDDLRFIRPEKANYPHENGCAKPERYHVLKVMDWAGGVLDGLDGRYTGGPMCFDGEALQTTTYAPVDEAVWSPLGPGDSPHVVARKKCEMAEVVLNNRYRTGLVRAFLAGCPTAALCEYDSMPGPIYWPAVKHDENAIKDWWAGNDLRVEVGPLLWHRWITTGGHLYTLKAPTSSDPRGEGWDAVCNLVVPEALRLAGADGRERGVLVILNPDYAGLSGYAQGTLPPGVLVSQARYIRERWPDVQFTLWSGPRQWMKSDSLWLSRMLSLR